MHKKDDLWKQLYSHEGAVFAYIKNTVGDADIARDLFQDVYLSALKNLSNISTGRSLKNWLYTITRNRVINYFRYHKRREFTEIDEEKFQSNLLHTEDPDLFKSVLNQLPERQKSILLLREIDGFSYKELGEQFGLTVSATTALLRRARENFQKHYLLNFLPVWLADIGKAIDTNDLFRFLNPFNPPVNIVDVIDNKRKQYFSTITKGWDDIRSGFITDSDLQVIFKNVQLTEGQQTADLGCGTGFVSIPLALLGLHVYALDADRGMVSTLQQARTDIGLSSIKVLRGDVRELPFKKDMFDNIFLVLVLHHIPDPFALLGNCASLLKENGNLIMVDFARHHERELADQMHDLWLGFNPDAIKKRMQKMDLKFSNGDMLRTSKKLPTFYQIWTKA